MGRFEDAVLSLFTKRASVTEVSRVGTDFSLVRLAGDELRGVSWLPGQKVQLAVRGFSQRTFTPLSWDAKKGTTTLFVYAHGDGPVARWAGALAPGAECSIFGPRASLDLSTLDRPGLVFGDETSFALAHALRFTERGSSGVELVFEVTSPRAAEDALAVLEIHGARLVERLANDAHLSTVEQVVEKLVRERAPRGAVLTGKASSIQAVSRRLRALGVDRRSIFSKAYWAPGKTGLD
jgi:ferric-chelate reductase (NADPH)